MQHGVLVIELWTIAILVFTPVAEVVLHWNELRLLHLANSPDLVDLALLPLEDLRR